jgi:hypothetical protein
MRRLAFLTLAVGLFLPLLASAPAHAQATRTWVSGVGDDANPCSRTAPCKTFAGAISKTAAAGEINCLDPGGFGGVTITKSITLNCHEVFGSLLVSGTNAIIINAAAADRVVLRNLQIQGVAGGAAAAGLVGIKILSAAVVSIEDCVVTQFSQQGILDQRTGAGGKLMVTNTTLTHNTGAGISVAGVATNNAVLDGVRSFNNAFGLAAGNGNNVTVRNSDFSSNGTGVQADSSANISVNSSALNSNGTAVVGAGVRVSDSDINFNTISAFSGNPTSFGTNRLVGNAAVGTFATQAQQ